ncbi:RNA polymerase sigma factor [Dysgonomonas sp. 520]|uniref:RNA polymerase sigma factor n=1 Tax=Dysgonomonas sp. 520 TaxID=2302931 RepID=UPI0013D648EE|nr:sigma-70 family RNA polymerase sigma factor [Dysgonomonas sp. 520]NDW10851.1 sigma-70 family RNA polymerase sigma factor [Dysgonomonas sp. 520]
MNEKLLIARCKRGESQAYRELYELYAPAMMSVCMRYVNNKETAQDLLQEGFIKIFTKIDTYSETGAFSGWIRRIFVTTALQYLRSNDALKQSVDIEECEGYINDMDFSALDQISADELMASIAELPEGYRTVFNLFALEGYSHSEIAEMLGVKESTSRSQFVRAKKILQKRLESLVIVKETK